MNDREKYLCDEKSRFIYANRLKYAQTKEQRFLDDIVDRTVRNRREWRELCDHLQSLASRHSLVMFGAGVWGNILCKETRKFISWKCAIDSSSDRKINGLNSVCFDDFIGGYAGEIVVISSYKNYLQMRDQLLKYSVPVENIINAGETIYWLTEYAIYFDLPFLMPQEPQEIFVDAGAFDGLTTKRFFEWCNDKGFSYCFEPDPMNMKRIRENLPAQAGYEIVPKALWSEAGFVSMDLRGSFASAVHEGEDLGESQRIETVMLDEFIGERKVTYIKMDIEGAEEAALRGAKNTIMKQKPRLAVSIYHKPEDIYVLPEMILSYNPHYRLYLRHYSFSYYDTVLYAIPE